MCRILLICLPKILPMSDMHKYKSLMVQNLLKLRCCSFINPASLWLGFGYEFIRKNVHRFRL